MGQSPEKLKYLVPGEFAGKRTFKETLVNRAPNGSPDSQDLDKSQELNSSGFQFREHNPYSSQQQPRFEATPERRDNIDFDQKRSQITPIKQEIREDATPRRVVIRKLPKIETQSNEGKNKDENIQTNAEDKEQGGC